MITITIGLTGLLIFANIALLFLIRYLIVSGSSYTFFRHCSPIVNWVFKLYLRTIGGCEKWSNGSYTVFLKKGKIHIIYAGKKFYIEGDEMYKMFYRNIYRRYAIDFFRFEDDCNEVKMIKRSMRINKVLGKQ